MPTIIKKERRGFYKTEKERWIASNFEKASGRNGGVI